MINLRRGRNSSAHSRAPGYLLLLVGFLAVRMTQAADTAAANTPKVIPWNQIGAKAGADYKGDGLAVTPTETGARLHCVFQRLEGEATPDGLWLTSTITNTVTDRFRVLAMELGRKAEASSSKLEAPEKLENPSANAVRKVKLDHKGKVTVNRQTVRFSRPGLTEEYSVSMDGVRQDFVVTEKPSGSGELRLDLTVSGARVEPAADGARLVLDHSGRKIAYSRLRVTDANGKELPARIEVCRKRRAPSPQPSPPVGEREALGEDMELAVAVNDTEAVYPVRIDPTFSDANWIGLGGLPGTTGAVSAAAVDASGNLYIGGDFTAAGSVIANNIAEWNGTNWSALGSGIEGGNVPVLALAVSGNTLYAGGEFTMAGGNAANYLAQWNGSSWSALGSGVSGGGEYGPYVFALAVSGNTLYAGGGFTTAGGSAANYIAQWNGSNWSALGSGVSGGDQYGPFVSALAVSGNTLYAGGGFTTAGSTNANYIAQWNGSSWSALGSGVSGGGGDGPYVAALAVSGSTLYAGGYFTTAGNTNANNIAQWNGSSWSPLGSGVLGGDNGTSPNVNALAVSGSTVYAGGNFTEAGDVSATNIAQWNGSSWSALGLGIGGRDAFVDALAASGNTLYAGGGNVTTAGGSAANNIAQWNGTNWSGLGSALDMGMNGNVLALAVSGSTLYAGGGFTTAGGIAANYIAQWNGGSWSALGSGVSGKADGFVYALAVSGNTLYVGGVFTNAGGISANYIARWNGTNWSALGSGLGGYVVALAVSGNTLYAGGEFTTAGGVSAIGIARWNGSSWSALGSGMGGANPTVYALAVSGNTLYAGGEFTTAGGVSATNIAQWNGSSWSALGSGIGGFVAALAASGNTLYAGGYFTSAGGVSATNIAQWNGSSWSALGSGMNNEVYALAVSGSNLYAGGNFTKAGLTNANCIAQWNGSSWSPLGSGMKGVVYALAVSGSTLYAGGYFTTAGTNISINIAEAYLVAPPGGLVDSLVVPSSGTADVRCYGNPGQQFGVQRTTTLWPPVWTNVSSSPLIPAADGSFSLVDSNAPPSAAYYRAFQY